MMCDALFLYHFSLHFSHAYTQKYERGRHTNRIPTRDMINIMHRSFAANHLHMLLQKCVHVHRFSIYNMDMYRWICNCKLCAMNTVSVVRSKLLIGLNKRLYYWWEFSIFEIIALKYNQNQNLCVFKHNKVSCIGRPSIRNDCVYRLLSISCVH